MVRACCEQGPAGRRRRHALARAGEQRRAERLLHAADAGGGGGQRQGARSAPAGDGAGLDHFAEEAQVRQVDRSR